ncbi:hypothetical protein ACFFX0_09045 [Citricoccus parietis]|uniref:Uncharacterized protein n=1 Tax=Citricoccus parietis TaxID=592307 RepID=A0ABV5FXC4_9MICC
MPRVMNSLPSRERTPLRGFVRRFARRDSRRADRPSRSVPGRRRGPCPSRGPSPEGGRSRVLVMPREYPRRATTTSGRTPDRTRTTPPSHGSQ